MGDPPSQEPPMQAEMTQVIPETFSVVLTEKVPAKDKVKMSREIRNATGLDLREVQNLMDAGSVVKSGLSREEAETVKTVLEKAGGSVEVRSEKKE
jgi:large subunit ribosomal protein L7/L12